MPTATTKHLSMFTDRYMAGARYRKMSLWRAWTDYCRQLQIEPTYTPRRFVHALVLEVGWQDEPAPKRRRRYSRALVCPLPAWRRDRQAEAGTGKNDPDPWLLVGGGKRRTEFRFRFERFGFDRGRTADHVDTVLLSNIEAKAEGGAWIPYRDRLWKNRGAWNRNLKPGGRYTCHGWPVIMRHGNGAEESIVGFNQPSRVSALEADE